MRTRLITINEPVIYARSSQQRVACDADTPVYAVQTAARTAALISHKAELM